jgi:hypothetical protein
MTEHGLFTINDPDDKGKVTVKYKLKPFYQYTFDSIESARTFIYGFWAGFLAKIEDK